MCLSVRLRKQGGFYDRVECVPEGGLIVIRCFSLKFLGQHCGLKCLPLDGTCETLKLQWKEVNELRN